MSNVIKKNIKWSYKDREPEMLLESVNTHVCQIEWSLNRLKKIDESRYLDAIRIIIALHQKHNYVKPP